MNWRLIPLVLIGLLAGMPFKTASGETRLSGAVSGVWEVRGSPFTIIGDITLARNETLRIQPGVTVTFAGNFRFNVNGQLTAEGTSDSPIVFQGSSQQPGSWRGIYFSGNGSDRSIVSHCVIRYAYQGFNLDDSDPQISNCSISFCTDTGVAFSRSLGKLTDCKIFRISGSGLKISGSSRATVRSCSIATCGDNGIVVTDAAAPTLDHNYIGGVSDHGIHLNSAAACSVVYNVIYQAGVRGLSISESNGALVLHNVTDGATGQGAYLYRSSGVQLINNTILNSGENGVQVSSNVTGNIENNIIENSDGYGILLQGGNPRCDYNNLHNNADGDYHDVAAGQHDMHIPSSLDGNYNPHQGNGLIDAGDPTLPQDPDGTRADIGAGFFNQNSAPNIRSVTPNWQQDTTIVADTILFTANVVDAQGHFVVWKWFVNGNEEWRNTSFNRIFNRDGEYTVRLLVDDRYYLGQSEYIWHFFVEGASVDPDIELPEGYALSEVYPNPFNGILNLKLSIPIHERVSISLLDLNGRFLESISTGELNAGDHQINFDAGSLPSGSYLIQAELGNYKLIRRTSLLK